MNFPWYEVIYRSDDITQGDIIKNCYIPLPDNTLFDAILDGNDEYTPEIEFIQTDIIIMTRACDITHAKIDSIIVCPLVSLETLINTNSYYLGSKARESLRQGKEPAYHLINKYVSNDLFLDFSIVDFHRIFSLPKVYIRKFAADIDQRLRLLPPYREHLSQALARYFMRVGLPQDIDPSAIKNYSQNM